MNIITWIILGALSGWIASLIAGTDERQGIFGNIFVGIIGALVGGFFVSLLGGEGVSGLNLYSVVVAVVGAVVVLYLWKQVA